MIENSFYSYVPTDWFDGSIQWIPTSFEWTSGPGTLWDGVLWLLKRSLDARCGSQTPPPSPFPLSSHFPMIIEAQTSMYPGEAAPLHSLVAGSMCGGRDSFFCTWNWCKSKVHLINIDNSAKSWIAMWPSTLYGPGSWWVWWHTDPQPCGGCGTARLGEIGFAVTDLPQIDLQ